MHINGINDLPAKPTSDTTSKTTKAMVTDGQNLDPGSAEVLSGNLPNIRKAQASEEVNAQAVQEARKMLADGTLDTPEIIIQAAENLVSLGI